MQNVHGSSYSDASDRSSIWTIPEGWEATYLGLFVSQVLIWTSLLSWRTACCSDETNVFDIVLAVGTGTAAIMVTSAGTSMILVECIVIYAEKFLKKRYDEGVQRGLERGRSVGIKEANARWEDWYRQRIEAEARGEEPPPPPNATD